MDSIHKYDHNGLEKTINGFGYMHQPSEITNKFIKHAEELKGTLLDIGCAYGVATIPSLVQGANVYACDVDMRHLEILKKRTPKQYHAMLRLIHGRFPCQIDFTPDSFDAILISHVLSFLSPQEIEEGIRKIFDWLKIGGKIFIINYTPYHKSLRDFIPIYEKGKQDGDKWPGLIKNKDEYGDSVYLKNNLPDQLMLFDMDILKNLIQNYSFSINECYYLGSKTEFVPEPFRMDGREWVGLIATKNG